MAGDAARLTLPAVLKPYVTLLFDGFGGPNSRDVSAVMRLTPKQVALWYAGPMAEMQKKTAEAKTDNRPAALKTIDGFESFKASFSRFPEYADQPAEWWRQKWEEWKQDQG